MIGGDPTAGEDARIFGVAVPVAEPYAAELEAWRERFGDPLAHAVPAHVTLVPPTEVASARVEELERHLVEVAEAGEPFELQLRGTGTFRPVSPVVFVAVVDGIAGCEGLERAARTGPLAGDLRFPYHPHVTVAHHVPDAVLDEAFEALADYDVRFLVERFALYEHGSDGIWRTLRDYPLGEPVGP